MAIGQGALALDAKVAAGQEAQAGLVERAEAVRVVSAKAALAGRAGGLIAVEHRARMIAGTRGPSQPHRCRRLT